MGTLLLALGGLLVVSTAVLVASCLRLRSAIGFLLAVYLFATAEVVLVSLALSPARLLTRTALLLVFGAGLAAALVAVDAARTAFTATALACAGGSGSAP